MATPVTQLHMLRLMLQLEQNVSGLQNDIRRNAKTWAEAVASASVPVETLAQWMTDTANAYALRLQWMSDFKNDPVNAPKLQAMWLLLGGTLEDVTAITDPLTTAVTSLVMMPKTTYAEIIALCDLLTSSIDAPLSLWPE
jgi:hypothetical protein